MVIEWRLLSQKRQQESIEFDHQLDRALAREHKMLRAEEKEAKEQRDKAIRKARSTR